MKHVLNDFNITIIRCSTFILHRLFGLSFGSIMRHVCRTIRNCSLAKRKTNNNNSHMTWKTAWKRLKYLIEWMRNKRTEFMNAYTQHWILVIFQAQEQHNEDANHLLGKEISEEYYSIILRHCESFFFSFHSSFGCCFVCLWFVVRFIVI